MICKIQVIIIGEDGLEETRELACLERTDLKPETLADELLVPWNVLRPFKGSEIEFDNDEPSGSTWLSLLSAGFPVSPLRLLNGLGTRN